MKALETGLHNIESSLERKLLYKMLFDNIKSGKIPASRFLRVLMNNIGHETAFDVL